MKKFDNTPVFSVNIIFETDINFMRDILAWASWTFYLMPQLKFDYTNILRKGPKMLTGVDIAALEIN